jgi:hypothetical protein
MKTKTSRVVHLIIALLLIVQLTVFAAEATAVTGDDNCQDGVCTISDHQSDSNVDNGKDSVKDNRKE